MNVIKEFNNALQGDNQENKELLELSLKKVRMTKNINELRSKFTEKLHELLNIKEENIVLNNDVLGLQKRVEIAKVSIEELHKKIVDADNQTKKIQVSHNYDHQ